MIPERNWSLLNYSTNRLIDELTRESSSDKVHTLIDRFEEVREKQQQMVEAGQDILECLQYRVAELGEISDEYDLPEKPHTLLRETFDSLVYGMEEFERQFKEYQNEIER